MIGTQESRSVRRTRLANDSSRGSKVGCHCDRERQQYIKASNAVAILDIIQGALVIGGTSKNPSLVTIDASDASGNPLARIGLVATTSIPNAPSSDVASLADPLGYTTNSKLLADSPPLVSSLSASPAAVSEPSSLLLLAVGGLLLARAIVRYRHRGRDG
jgi:hypothetical protein